MKHIILFALFVGVIWACSKEGENDPSDKVDGKKIEQIVMRHPSDSVKFEFNYDGNGRIITIYMRSSNSSFVPTFSMTRDQSGKVISLIHMEAPRVTTSFEYSLGSDGKYLSANIIQNDQGRTSSVKETYTYTGNNLTRIDRVGTNSASSPVKFTYDNNGNIIKVESGSSGTTIINAKYDKKVNPLGSLDFPAFMLPEVISGTNRNNILTKETNNSTGKINQTNTYTYDEGGLPLSANVLIVNINGYAVNYEMEYVYKIP